MDHGRGQADQVTSRAYCSRSGHPLCQGRQQEASVCQLLQGRSAHNTGGCNGCNGACLVPRYQSLHHPCKHPGCRCFHAYAVVVSRFILIPVLDAPPANYLRQSNLNSCKRSGCNYYQAQAAMVLAWFPDTRSLHYSCKHSSCCCFDGQAVVVSRSLLTPESPEVLQTFWLLFIVQAVVVSRFILLVLLYSGCCCSHRHLLLLPGPDSCCIQAAVISTSILLLCPQLRCCLLPDTS